MYRDHSQSIFKKAMVMDEEDYFYIDGIKGKKSKAGKLKEIINFYRTYGLKNHSK